MDEIPEWILTLLADPASHDSEWGRSCHFCESSHGRYDEPLLHYIDCPWIIAMDRAGLPLPSGHGIFEPKRSTPCERCGWYYNSREDWRGREMPPPAGPELQLAHDTHIAEDHGITIEEYYAGPPRPDGAIYNLYNLPGSGTFAWHMIWGTYSIKNCLPVICAPRGGIKFVAPPPLEGLDE